MSNYIEELAHTIKDHALKSIIVIILGSILIYVGVKLLDVHIELYRGIHLIDEKWITAIYLLPFVVGALIVMAFGPGGSWICWIPPVIVEGWAYIDTAYITGVPEDAQLIPLGYWVYYMVLMVGAAAIGGFSYQIFMNYRDYIKKRSRKPKPKI
ncbi:MAG: hypothetical protein V4443_03715 [Pseudomonadota bacterium]